MVFIDIIIPGIAYYLVYRYLGSTIFICALILGAIAGICAIFWLFIEKDPDYNNYKKWWLNLWKKVKKFFVHIFKLFFFIK